MADYIAEVRNAIGENVVKKLCDQANSGKITVIQGKKFSRLLGDSVCGNFMRERRDEVGKINRDEMEQILSDFWKEEGICGKEQEELLNIISEALNSAQIPLVIIPSETNASKTANIKAVPRLTQFYNRLLCWAAQNKVSPAEGVNKGLVTDEVEAIPLVEGEGTRPAFLRSTSAQCTRRRRCKKRWWLPPTIIASVIIIALVTWDISLYAQELPKDSLQVTRSIWIGGVGKPLMTVIEIHQCDVNQTIVPDLPVALHEHVGLLVNKDILVCGGTSSETIPHNPKTCLTHTLGSDTWEPFPYEMNTNRRSAHAKISDNKVFVTDQEVWSLEERSKGWSFETVTHSQGLGDVCSPSAVIIDIPCK